MFKFHKTRDIITLFHKANSPASTRVATLLKQASATASEHATEDQASDHAHQTHPSREEFELNITEDPPTADQLRTILDYVGDTGVGSIVEGASTASEALKKYRENKDAFKRPVVVDWNNGKAVGGSNESAILKMVNALPKEE